MPKDMFSSADLKLMFNLYKVNESVFGEFHKYCVNQAQVYSINYKYDHLKIFCSIENYSILIIGYTFSKM